MSPYLRDIDLGVARIQSFFNADPNSRSYGSFDRYYWSWKKRDFQDATLAFAWVALERASRWTRVAGLERMRVATLGNLLRLQHRNGSFDQSYPFEKHPKIGLDISEVFYLSLKKERDPEIEKAYRRLLDYSLQREESYGVICNHLAHHAYEYLLGYELLGDEKYYTHAKRGLEAIEQATHSEGWHQEYLGGDPGYQTRTLKYLVHSLAFWKEPERAVAERLCRESAAFLEKLILPDGTLYAMFGSRNTALIYPSGLEFLAARLPAAAAAAACRRIRSAMENQVAILPLTLEFDNFIRLFEDHLSAHAVATSLEAQEESRAFFLPEFGLRKWVSGSHSVYFHFRYGGSLAVYQGTRAIAKDAGFLLQKERDFWGTRNLLTPAEGNATDGEGRTRSSLFYSIHRDLTPWQLVVLRLLNLTVLRVPGIGDVFRKILVSVLITGKPEKAPGRFERRVRVRPEAVEIDDCLELDFVPTQIERRAYLNLFHMASSRYDSASDSELATEEPLPEEFLKKQVRCTKVIALEN